MFRPQLKSAPRRSRVRYSLGEFAALREIVHLENQLVLRLLRLTLERERLKLAVLTGEYEGSVGEQDQALLLNRLQQLKSRVFQSQECTNAACIYDQFRSLPVTYLCPEIVDYVGRNY